MHKNIPKNIIINVKWWMYSHKSDDYEDYNEDVVTESKEKAIELMMLKYPRGKKFTI